jgi:ParB-like chromosome segregation protein Spo0J
MSPAKKKATKKKVEVDESALEWHSEAVEIGSLVEWEKNPRRLTSKQADDLRDSLKLFGYVESIIVDHDKKSIIGGHQRRRMMLQRLLVSPSALIEVRVPNRPLTAKEREQLAIRLNKNEGEWDWDALANNFEAEELMEWGFQPAEFGMEDSTSKSQEKEKKKKLLEQDDSVCTKCKRPF